MGGGGLRYSHFILMGNSTIKNLCHFSGGKITRRKSYSFLKLHVYHKIDIGILQTRF